MDYKYIEQLLNRYWECETTMEEENILRAFFKLQNLPEHFEQYKPLFDYESEQANLTTSEGFEERVLRKIQQEGNEKGETKKKRTAFISLRPLYNAVAMVAIVCMVALAAQHTFSNQQEEEWDTTSTPEMSYKESFTDPQVARSELRDMLKTMSSTFSDTQSPDSVENKEEVIND